MKLVDVLKMLDDEDVPCENVQNGDIRPNHVFRVNICYMSEEETWINTYPSHPILVPLYNASVISFTPSCKNTLDIWIEQEDWIQQVNEI